jgi:hypothetical protein
VVLHKLSLQLCIVKLAEFLAYAAHVDPTLQAATTWQVRNTLTGVLSLMLRVQKVYMQTGYIPFCQTRQDAYDVDDFYSTQHKTTQHSTAQHRTAQHSTSQHSTSQHNTVNTAEQNTPQH